MKRFFVMVARRTRLALAASADKLDPDTVAILDKRKQAAAWVACLFSRTQSYANHQKAAIGMGLIASSSAPRQMNRAGLAITVILRQGPPRATAENFQATSPEPIHQWLLEITGLDPGFGLGVRLDPDSFIARFNFISIT